MTGKVLETLGYPVTIANCGQEAIDIYKSNSGKFDLVILDMIMPTMGGGETFALLKSIDPAAKVILSSGYGAIEQVDEIMAQSCRAFIQKPFDMKELSIKVKAVLEDQ